jgi:hypothetical protein
MNRIVNRVVFAIGAMVTVLSIAFVGSGASTVDANVSDDMLRTMPLQKTTLGAEYAAFDYNEDAGFATNAHLIEDSDDAAEERLSIERSGRINGYSENYVSYDGIFSATGAVMICTGADLYAKSGGASVRLKDYLDQYKKEASDKSEDYSLQSYKSFDTSVGDESWGMTVSMLVIGAKSELGKDLELTSTSVAFRRGRIIGSVLLQRADRKDVHKEAIALARQLDKRIQGVVKGDIATAEPARTLREPAGVDLIRRAEKRMETVTTARVLAHQTTNVNNEVIRLNSDLKVQHPDRAWSKSLSKNEPELVRIGETFYGKDMSTGRWSCLNELGSAVAAEKLDVSVRDQLNFLSMAHEVKVLAPGQMNNQTIHHVQAVVDGKRVARMAWAKAQVEEKDRDKVTFSDMNIDMLINADMTLAKITMEFNVTGPGIAFSTKRDYGFMEFDAPFSIPLTGTYPQCGGKSTI